MAIITISRGSSSLGKTVAEQVARRLDYRLISREVLLDASTRFQIPEIKLEKAIHDAPGILERYRHSQQSYVAYIRSALVERVVDDNVVYHGLAGHLLLKGLGHVLKVRINAELKRRVAIVMERDKIPEEAARRRILEDDRQRQKWTQSLYGQDPWDASLYDLTICIDTLSVDMAVDFICRAAAAEGFQATESRRRKAQDMAMACRVKAALVDEFPQVGVTCDNGNVLVYTGSGGDRGSGKLAKKLRQIRDMEEKIFHLETHPGVALPPDAV